MPVAKIFELVTPWGSAVLNRLRYEQTNDLAVIAAYGYATRRLRRFDHNDWRIDTIPIGPQIDAPDNVDVTATNPQSGNDDYVSQIYRYAVTALNEEGQESVRSNVHSANNDLSLKGDFNTVTWDAVTGAVEYRIYAERSGIFGYMGRADGDETSFVDDNISADFSTTPPQSYNPFSGAQYPAALAFHEGRMFFGRTPQRPSAIFGSRSSDIFNFDKASPLLPADSIALSLRGKKVNAIQHLVAFGSLVAMTGDAIWTVNPTADGYLSPLSLKTKNEGQQGVGICRPTAIIDVLFYATKRGNEVRTLGYTFEKDGYRGNNVSVFAQHFFTGYTITHMCYAEVPSRVLWCLRDDGKLAALTWQQEQDVWGWTLCETDGVIESIAVVSETTRDSLYITVQRLIGGELVRYVERMAEPVWMDENWSDAEQNDCVVMDGAVTYRGTPTANLIGLDHLEGRDVSVLADGLVKVGHSVVGGALTPALDDEYATITVGLPYLSYIRTLPVVTTLQGSGSTKGTPQMPTAVVLQLLNTRGIEIGYGITREPGGLYDAELPNPGPTTPPGLFTGQHVMDDLPLGDWKEARVTVAQRNPLPMVVLNVLPSVKFGGR